MMTFQEYPPLGPLVDEAKILRHGSTSLSNDSFAHVLAGYGLNVYTEPHRRAFGWAVSSMTRQWARLTLAPEVALDHRDAEAVRQGILHAGADVLLDLARYFMPCELTSTYPAGIPIMVGPSEWQRFRPSQAQKAWNIVWWRRLRQHYSSSGMEAYLKEFYVQREVRARHPVIAYCEMVACQLILARMPTAIFQRTRFTISGETMNDFGDLMMAAMFRQLPEQFQHWATDV